MQQSPPVPWLGHLAEKGAKPVMSGLKDVKQLLELSQVATSLRVNGPGFWTTPETTQPTPDNPTKEPTKTLKEIKINY